MATCKDCVYFEACDDMMQAYGLATDGNGIGYLADSRCRIFKDKNIHTIQRWIPVTERLPDVFGLYVLVTDGRNVSSGCILNFKIKNVSPWLSKTPVMPGNITHWMPMPKPPKE